MALFFAFVRGYEEPTLRRQFGSEYEAYRRGGAGLVAASTAGTIPARRRAEQQLVAGLEREVGAARRPGREVLGRIRPSSRGV